MFDMRNIGKKIAGLRKERDMTQLELADKLGISYQAVSNWERGDSMPDISKLEELSEIFDISIDELLENKRVAKIAKEINEDKDIKDRDVTKEELFDAATLQKPKVIKEFVHNYSKKEESNKSLSNESLIISMAPFLDEDILEELIDERIDKNNLSQDFLLSMAPFLDEDYLGELFEKTNLGFNNLVAVAPFLDSDVLGKKAVKLAQDGEELHNLAGIAPFLDSDDLTKVAEIILKNDGSINDLTAVIPFLDEDSLDRIIDVDKHTINELLSAIPFLSSEKIAEMAKKAIDDNDLQSLQKLAPFIDGDALRDILKKRKA